MSSKQIKAGAIISYLAIAINVLTGLFYTPWMVGKIGQSQYALYTLANSLITLFLIDFGLSSATARYVSNYKAKERQQDIDNFLGVIYKLYAVIDLVIFLALTVYFFFIDSIYVSLTPEELEQFKVVYIMSASFSLINLPFVTQTGILTAYEKFIQLKLADLIYRVLLVGLTVLVLVLGHGLYALVAVHATAGILVIIYKQLIIKTSTPVRVNFRYKDSTLFKSIFKFSFWITIATLSQRLIFTISPTILGIVADSGQIAIFGVVTTIEGFIYTITTAINGMFMPQISKAYVEDEENAPHNLMPLLISVGKFNFFVNGLIVAGFLLVGKDFITLWMGTDYIDAYLGILLVVAPGLFYNSLQIANTAMLVKNKVHIQAIIAMIYGVVNVALSFVFSSLYGAIGACISICIAYSLKSIIYHFVHHKIMKFNIGIFIKKCYIKVFPCLVITLLIGVTYKSFFDTNSWMKLGIAAVFITCIYCFCAFFVGLSKAERKLLIQKIKRK